MLPPLSNKGAWNDKKVSHTCSDGFPEPEQNLKTLLMLSLDEDRAAQLFDNMDDKQLRNCSQAMANFGNVSSEIVTRS